MYLNVVTSLSSKNNELQGAPQSLTIFPPILISYPRTAGAFNCTGHMNPLNRWEKAVVFWTFVWLFSTLLRDVIWELKCWESCDVDAVDEEEMFGEMQISVPSSGNFVHSSDSGQGNWEQKIFFIK
jgi:hypothetical protein